MNKWPPVIYGDNKAFAILCKSYHMIIVSRKNATRFKN